MGQINPDLPDVGGDVDIWGNILNDAFVEVIAQGNASDAALANLTTRNVKSFGATTASADNRVAIQAAITASSAGDVVVIPTGTFTMGVDGSGIGIVLKAGVTLRIDGVLKLKSGSTGWVTLISMETDSVVSGSGTIDCNPTGNPLSATPTPGTRRVAANANAATGQLVFRDVSVYGYVGHNGIFFSSSAELGDALVVGTRWTATGIGTTAATAHDHSTLYLEAHRVQAVRNTFVGGSPYGAHAAVETHGASQIVAQNTVEDYVLFGNLTGVQVNDGDNIIWAQNIGRRVFIGVALYCSSVNGGSDPALRNVYIGANQFTIDRDYFLPFDPEMGAPVSYGIGLYSAQADLAIQNLTITGNNITFEPYSTVVATDEFNSAGVDLWRVTANATPDKNIRIENNTIVNPPGPGIRWATSNSDQLVIRDNLIVDPGGSVSTTIASAFRTGVIVTGGNHKNLAVVDNTIIDTRAVHKLASLIDVSLITTVAGGRVVDNVGRIADGTYVPEALTPNGAGKQFYVEAVQPGPWQGFWTSCAPGSRIRVGTTGDVYVNVQTVDGSAPSWVREQAGRFVLRGSDFAAASGPVGAIVGKAVVMDETGTVQLGWTAIYGTIT